ncbi:MAG: GNAT family N-acetyltransferase [Aggregatilineales bacterium]
MTTIFTKSIPTEATYSLRDTVMKQGKRATKPGDDAPDTLHAGTYQGDALVAIASIYHEAPPDSDEKNVWRLRGMASLESVRGQGYGKVTLLFCLDYIARQGGIRIWCNAREGAVGFYKNLGFHVKGDRFISADGIPHYFMWRDIAPDSSSD